MAKKTLPDPFASASRKPVGSPKKNDSNVIVASSFQTQTGEQIERQDLVEAIENYCDGHRMFEQGKAMKDASRFPILEFARIRHAQRWLDSDKRPANPKIHTSESGDGKFITAIFQDTVVKMTPERYEVLANLIGAQAAEENTIHRQDIVVNNSVLNDVCEVIIDGKKQKMTVIDAMRSSLQSVFSPSPEMLTKIFQIVENVETVKGLIDKGPKLVTTGKTTADVQRLARFLLDCGFTTQLKPGGGDDKE